MWCHSWIKVHSMVAAALDWACCKSFLWIVTCRCVCALTKFSCFVLHCPWYSLYGVLTKTGCYAHWLNALGLFWTAGELFLVYVNGLSTCYLIYRSAVTLTTIALLCWSSSGLCAGVSCMLVYLGYMSIALVVHWSSGLLCSIIYWDSFGRCMWRCS